jgi:2-oxoglutarate ferredoxin oxidoreductase subunit beta
MTTFADYTTKITPTWCPGCQNYLLLAALKNAFVSLNIPSKNLVMAYDIGCNGNMADFIKSYGIHTLHGRAVPTAMGVKIINPKLTVVVIAGDGGAYGEGLNHLIAAARSNIDIKVFVANNFLYSLTTGQTSPTTPKGASTKSTPLGNPNQPINPLKLISDIDPKLWVKNVTATDVKSLNQSVLESFKHSGFTLLDIHQQCVAFGKQLNS